MTNPRAAAAAESFADAARGDARPIAQVLASLDGQDPIERAWSLALRARIAGLDPARIVAPHPSDIAAPRSDEERRVASLTCVCLERAALLALAPEDLAAAIAAHESLLHDETDVSLAMARLWHDWMTGRSIDPARIDEVSRAASAVGNAASVVEATVLRALCTADQDEALVIGRRACRMAQAEAHPDDEGLAHLVLARLRRRSGRPHLAVHVLMAFAAEAAPAFHPWAAWELLLAGAAQRAKQLQGHLPRPPSLRATWGQLTDAGLSLLEAAQAADRAHFDRATTALRAVPLGVASVAEEAEALRALLDAESDDCDTVVGRWRSGEQAAVPFGLHAAGRSLGPLPSPGDTVASVIARRAGPGRRLLTAGAALCGQVARLEAPPPDAGGVRTETALAVLALAGSEGLALEVFFRAVYGFAYRADPHDGAVKVLLHRMRERLGACGTVVRDGAEPRLILSVAAQVLIPDGRSDAPPAERVLRALAALGSADTDALATTLDMPLRTVQRKLKQLVQDGVCQADRRGGTTSYRLQDTTFTTVHLPAPPRG